MKKILVSLLASVVLVVFGNYFYQNYKGKGRPQSAEQSTTEKTRVQDAPGQQAATSTPSNTKYYTMAEVAAHGADPNSEECWTVIHGKVYDILDFASNSHPGGEMIFDACGKDATTLFETRPMGSGTPHSENARRILEKYYIGDLKQ